MNPAGHADEVLSVPLPTRRSTIRLAQHLAPLLVAGDLVVLDGPLGSGKTFFVRAVGRALGWPSREPVTSPTFTLVNEYETTPKLVHADLYRLASSDEVVHLGLDEARREGAVVMVEWGAPYVDELGGDALLLGLAVNQRGATLASTGARSSTILERMRRVVG